MEASVFLMTKSKKLKKYKIKIEFSDLYFYKTKCPEKHKAMNVLVGAFVENS
jgi:hypothetical protein